MPKRKAEEPLEPPLYRIPPAQPHNARAFPPAIEPSKSFSLAPYHPPVTSGQLANCRAGLCHHCQFLSDIKLKYELLYARPHHANHAPPVSQYTEDEDDEPTIREDNVAFEKICELEAENEALRNELAELRKQGKTSLIDELKQEDDAGEGDIDDSGVELPDLGKESSDGDSDGDATISSDEPLTSISGQPAAQTTQPVFSSNWTKADLEACNADLLARAHASGRELSEDDEDDEDRYEQPDLLWSDIDEHGTEQLQSPSQPPIRRCPQEPNHAFLPVYHYRTEGQVNGFTEVGRFAYHNVEAANKAAWWMFMEKYAADRNMRIRDLDQYHGRKAVGKLGQMVYACEVDLGWAYVKVEAIRLL